MGVWDLRPTCLRLLPELGKGTVAESTYRKKSRSSSDTDGSLYMWRSHILRGLGPQHGARSQPDVAWYQCPKNYHDMLDAKYVCSRSYMLGQVKPVLAILTRADGALVGE